MLSLIYGFLAACVAGILQLVLFVIWPSIFSLDMAFVLVFVAILLLAATEELTRIIFAVRLISHSEPLSPSASLYFGIGFACLEIFLYLFVTHAPSILLVGIILVHLFLSWLTFRLLPRLSYTPIFIILLVSHTIYNLLLYGLS